MNTLYYVTAYHHQRNKRARVLVTAENADKATDEVALSLNSTTSAFYPWRIEDVTKICETPDTVFEER